jgi:hypothetical protein
MPCTWNQETLRRNILKIEDSKVLDFNAMPIYSHIPWVIIKNLQNIFFIHQNDQTQHLVCKVFMGTIEPREFVAHKYKFTPNESTFHNLH